MPSTRMCPARSWFTALRISVLGISVLAGCVGASFCFQHLRAAPPSSEASSERAAVVAEIAGIKEVYSDVKLAFDLAEDEEGYDTLKETVDLFLGGVNRTKPCDYRIFTTRDGLQTVLSLPVNTTADFGKFVQYLWDVDVKTAPVPNPALTGRMPAAVRMRLQSLKIQPNERIVFSLMDGFMRHDAGYVHLGESLEAVRLARGASGIASKDSGLTVRIDGQSGTTDHRREAFRKSSQRILAELTRDESTSETAFSLEKALLERQLAGLEVVFCEASQGKLDVVVSHTLKRLNILGEVTPTAGTSLADHVQRIGKSVDAFAGVSRQGTVLSGSVNLPVHPAIVDSLKKVIGCARSAMLEHLERDSEKNPDHDAADTAFANFVCDVAAVAAAQADYNGMVRIWSNSNGTLTTVGAIRIGNGTPLQESLQNIKNETVSRAIGETKIIIRKCPVHHWSREYAELFDQEGTVSIAIEKDQLWFAFGENSVDRLEQALREASGKASDESVNAIELQARLRPLGEVWNKIHARHSATTEKTSKKAKKGGKASTANWAGIVADLNLPQIAASAFSKTDDSMSLTLKRDGDKAAVAAQFDAGTLRFIGKALSRFVKNNLN